MILYIYTYNNHGCNLHKLGYDPLQLRLYGVTWGKFTSQKVECLVFFR